MRPIDADDLITAFPSCDSSKPVLVASVRATINHMPTIDHVPEWIPVSERLPEKYIGQWLCYTSDGDVMILSYDTPGDGTKECVFYKWDDDGYFYQTFNVIAWMPLPEPYKEAKEEKCD